MDKTHLEKLNSEINSNISSLQIKDLQQELMGLEEQISKPDFWNDQELAKDVSKRAAKLREKVTPWVNLRKRARDLLEMSNMDDPALTKELSTMLVNLKADYSELKKNLRFSGPYDDHDAILSIHAGTGGTDAMDWAQMLERMYIRYAEGHAFKAEILDETQGEEAGIKSATIRISGSFVYGKLKGEHGVHRLVRQSPFNSDNLRQTSFALIEVIPEIDSPEEVDIDEKDLKIDVFRSGGRGGQSVNTTDSAVRITHIPTGIVVSIQNERSQIQNRQTAMKILNSKIVQLKNDQHKDKLDDLKGPDQQAAWGNQIRNYVFHPYTLVKDSRTGFETNDIQAVMDGKLDELIEAYLEKSANLS